MSDYNGVILNYIDYSGRKATVAVWNPNYQTKVPYVVETRESMTTAHAIVRANLVLKGLNREDP